MTRAKRDDGLGLALEVEREKRRIETEHQDEEKPWLEYPHTFAEHIFAEGRAPFPGGWITYPWIEYLSVRVHDTFTRGGARLIVEMPPQHGKSVFCDIVVPLWIQSKWPKRRVMLASYEADFAASWGGQVLEIAKTNSEVPIEVARHVRSKKRWKNVHGGGMMTGSPEAPFPGNPGDDIIIDDIIKNDAVAYSKTKRDHVYRWLWSGAFTRVQPGSNIMIPGTRWHEDDPVGQLLASKHGKGWEVISFPAFAEDNDLLGRAVGETLHGRFDPEFYEAQRDGMAPALFNALYQQRPSAAKGDIFLREWFRRFYMERPKDSEFEQIVISWDMAFKDTDNTSFVVGQAWGRKGAELYLLDQIRERMNFTRTLDALIDLAALHPSYQIILVEEAANGAAVIATLREHVQKLLPVGRPSDSKISRANSYAPLVRAGNWILPAREIAPWIDDFIEEHVSCPNGRTWDQIDAAGQAMAEMKIRMPVRFVPPVGVFMPSAWSYGNRRETWGDGENQPVAWERIN